MKTGWIDVRNIAWALQALSHRVRSAAEKLVIISRQTPRSTFRWEEWKGLMEIGVIGAGNVGAALATAWMRAGHSILLGLRDAGKHGELIKRTGARALTPAEAAQGAEVVVLALPYAAVEPVVSELGPLAGKILIDATNPVTRTDHGPDLALGFTDSAAEALARQVPQARVVKTLNQVGAEVMEDTSGFAHPPVMSMAGRRRGRQADGRHPARRPRVRASRRWAVAPRPAARASGDGLDQPGLAARPRPQLGLRGSA